MLLGAVLAVTADLWIFVILIPLGLLDYLYDSYQVKRAERRPKRRAARHARIAEARSTPALRAPRDEPTRHELPEDRKRVSKDDAGPAGAGIPAAKAPLSPRASQAAFACYAGLAILLWLFILAMGHQPGAVAAMHALQG
jgi:hypothetical protein